MDTNKVKIDSKKMLAQLAEQRAKVKFSDRVELEIVKPTKHYKLGQLISPHSTFAKVLISSGVAKKVK